MSPQSPFSTGLHYTKANKLQRQVQTSFSVKFKSSGLSSDLRDALRYSIANIPGNNFFFFLNGRLSH